MISPHICNELNEIETNYLFLHVQKEINPSIRIKHFLLPLMF